MWQSSFPELVTSRTYANGTMRRTALKTTLSELIGFPIRLEWNDDNNRPDGIVKYKTQCGEAVILLKEDENELGTGHPDPSTQAGFGFRTMLCFVQNSLMIFLQYQIIRDPTCCPTFRRGRFSGLSSLIV
jgi:hypothetical protein